MDMLSCIGRTVDKTWRIIGIESMSVIEKVVNFEIIWTCSFLQWANCIWQYVMMAVNGGDIWKGFIWKVPRNMRSLGWEFMDWNWWCQLMIGSIC